MDPETGLGLETLIEGDVDHHHTIRGLYQVRADFRTSIFIRDNVAFTSKIPIYVVNLHYFRSNEIIAREYRADAILINYGIVFEFLPKNLNMSLIDKKSFPMTSYSSEDWYLMVVRRM